MGGVFKPDVDASAFLLKVNAANRLPSVLFASTSKKKTTKYSSMPPVPVFRLAFFFFFFFTPDRHNNGKAALHSFLVRTL